MRSMMKGGIWTNVTIGLESLLYFHANLPLTAKLGGANGLILPLKRFLNGQQNKMIGCFIFLSLCHHSGEQLLQLLGELLVSVLILTRSFLMLHVLRIIRAMGLITMILGSYVQERLTLILNHGLLVLILLIWMMTRRKCCQLRVVG